MLSKLFTLSSWLVSPNGLYFNHVWTANNSQQTCRPHGNGVFKSMHRYKTLTYTEEHRHCITPLRGYITLHSDHFQYQLQQKENGGGGGGQEERFKQIKFTILGNRYLTQFYQHHGFQTLLGETYTHFETITFLHSKCTVSSSIMQPFAEGEIKKQSIHVTSPFYTRYLRCNKPRENAKMQQWLLQTNPNATTEMSASDHTCSLWKNGWKKTQTLPTKLIIAFPPKQLKIASSFSQKTDTLK